MADEDVEMVGEVPVAVEEVRKLSPEMEASRLIYCYSTEDRPAEKEALKQSVLQLIEKNSASAVWFAVVSCGNGAHVFAVVCLPQSRRRSTPHCALDFRGQSTKHYRSA